VTLPTAYLDTNLVSGLAKRDLRAREHKALRELLRLHKAGSLALVTSHVTREEIERLPGAVRELHEDIYALLVNVREALEVGTDSGLTLMGVGGGTREEPDFTELKPMLPDVDDARHVFQALRNDVDYFVTDDERTIISRAPKIATRFKIRPILPSARVEELMSSRASPD
jgi:hypothetical protein